MKLIKFVGMLVILNNWVFVANATDIAFMPGDAFFATRLTQESIKRFEKKDAPSFLPHASPPTYEPDFGGSCGYTRLVIEDMPQEWVERLKDVYGTLRFFKPREVQLRFDKAGNSTSEYETNGFWMLVYNRSFNFETYRIGLLYNETWDDPLPDVKPPLFLTVVRRYQPYIFQLDAINQDLLHGQRVDGLKVNYPDLGERHVAVNGKPIREPVAVSSKEIRLVILPEQNLEE